jgi:hypothetical protein
MLLPTSWRDLVGTGSASVPASEPKDRGAVTGKFYTPLNARLHHTPHIHLERICFNFWAIGHAHSPIFKANLFGSVFLFFLFSFFLSLLYFHY